MDTVKTQTRAEQIIDEHAASANDNDTRLDAAEIVANTLEDKADGKKDVGA